MEDDRSDQFVFEREFDSMDSMGAIHRVRLEIDIPYRVSDEHENPRENQWVCHLRIIGIRNGISRREEGRDAIDAFLHALIFTTYFLKAQTESVSWQGQSDLGLYVAFGGEDNQQTASHLSENDEIFSAAFDRFFQERKTRED